MLKCMMVYYAKQSECKRLWLPTLGEFRVWFRRDEYVWTGSKDILGKKET